MKKLFWSLMMSGMFFAATAGFAVQVTTLYRANIPVTTQSSDERNKSLQQGLGQVLIKVSGNSAILQNPDVKSHLHLADSLMQQFSYAAAKDKIKPFILQMDFDPEGVNKILRDAHVPLWGQVRPLILVWMDYAAPNHPAEILNTESANGTAAALKADADARGIPMIFPMMDMTDMNQVSANDIATMAIPNLQAAAKRYQSDAILIGHITQANTGFTAQWKLVLGDQQWDWSSSGNQVADLLSGVTDNVANTLAARYSGVMSNNVKTTVTLKVSGITAPDDYSQLMSYLEHLPPVMDVEPQQVTGSDVTISIRLRGDIKLLTQAISLGQKLTPETVASPDASVLMYQWNH